MGGKVFESFETIFLDLDGVIYEGANAIPGAVESILKLQQLGVRIGYITNNSSRRPQTIAEQISGFGIPVNAKDIISSAQSGVELLATLVPAGSKVLVVGGDGLRSRVEAEGFEVVNSSDDHPVAVIQGFAPDVSWRDLAEASYAIAKGAKWVATNQDWTIPREKGLAPGNGTLVSAVHTAVGQLPLFAGKPETKIFETAKREFGVTKSIYVGDRLDTDVLGANRSGMASGLVMTGVTTKKELLAAKSDSRPSFIFRDLKDLLSVYQTPSKTKRGFKLGESEVELLGDRVMVSFGDPKSFDALKCACLTIWESGRPIHTLEVEAEIYE